MRHKGHLWHFTKTCTICKEIVHSFYIYKHARICQRCLRKIKIKWTIRPYFNRYDFWIGTFYDHKSKTLYIQLFPMFGLKIRKVTEYAT